ncbi:uncharacterized protein SPAPADRAFT_147448 [Spathaspora passalidarum NRRL Y-27907]|uniref:PH domain-containing protein n=1 Tax=Spathaspora passalidarum (strain NRRL Y-27907 / 11-Y1) TaxID=619300 RepID=G3AEW4_SPAPN|nr:uncharacterized protein SPAPADRAFT_147448 [Spathaspora passalidarum NRRL Y-27907]EGW35794.1 hypothetical protein SPAPADRAFT_147448 [Spathaspora passalidarum NRRL Y-27907]
MSTDDPNFTIPKASYTAPLISLLSSDVISQTSKCMFIGGIPAVWHNDKSTNIMTSSRNTSVPSFENHLTVPIGHKKGLLSLPSASNESLQCSIPMSVTSRNSRMLLELPHPITQLNIETINQEKTRVSKRLRSLTHKSKGKRRDKIRDFRDRILNSLISPYQSGEIVRADRMLVMIKEIVGNVKENFDGDELESRVYERWKEYIVVLRRTYSSSEPLMLQFYDIAKAPNADNAKQQSPRVGFSLNSKISAKFYNILDKSISLTARQGDDTFSYILKCNNQTKALRWLYFIKSSLGHDMNTMFNIYIHHVGQFLQVKIPENILEKAVQSIEEVHIREKKTGYEVQHSVLLQYLKNTIKAKFKHENISFSNSWFCFRFYDRLEWVADNSELLFIGNVLYTPTFQLEYRTIELTSVYTPTYKLEEPVPIEGFLARLTSTSGRSKGLVHDFYKISYFFTNKNLLFFTKYYRVLPPASENYFLASQVSSKTPIVYEQCLYPSDGNGHIAWLRDDFTTGDDHCFSEFERRTQQIVRAEGLIDLSRIVQVRAIPSSTMSHTQKLLSAHLWYASSGLIDNEEIQDSCFEIELATGCVIKLQAHSRHVRDRWILHLQLLSQFWAMHEQEQIQRQIAVRSANLNNLNACEYVDSNAGQQINHLELKYTEADTKINNISSMISTTLVLKSGFLYHKRKKHSTFNQFFALLCPGFLILFNIFKRSKNTGAWKKTSYFEHYLTIPISECYIYAGFAAELDLLESKSETRGTQLERHSVPRLHTNGWRSQEEECSLCFTLWFGKKRNISNYERNISKQQAKPVALHLEKNPGLIKMVAKLGLTGRSVMFMTNSRQDRDQWVSRILGEMDRF